MKVVKRRVFKFHEVSISQISDGWQGTIYGPPRWSNPRGDIVALTKFRPDSKAAFRDARKAIRKLALSSGTPDIPDG